MKRLLMTAVMLFLASTARAQHIQQCGSSNVTGTGFSSVSCTLPQATTAGDALAVGVTYGGNATLTASDSQGNAYSLICKAYDSGHNQAVAFLRAVNVAGGAGDKITVTFSSGMPYLALGVHEYAGISPTTPDGGCITSLGTVGQPASGSLSTTSSATLFSIAVEDSIGYGDTFTPGANFAMRANLGSAGAYADADEIAAPAGTSSTTWTLAPAKRNWMVLLAALNSTSQQPNFSASASLTWDDGTPVAGNVAVLQSIPTSTTTVQTTNLGTFPIDSNGHVAGSLVADFSQPDPLSFTVQLLDPSNTNIQTASFNVPKAMFPANVKGLSASIVLCKATTDIKSFQIGLLTP